MVVVIIVSIVVVAILAALLVVKWNEAKMFASQVDVVKAESEQRLGDETRRNEEAASRMKGEYEQRLADERQRTKEEVERLQTDHKQQITMLRTELENATRNILEKQSDKLKDNNAEQISTILNPLREQLRNMKETIDQNKDSHTRDASALREAMKHLVERSEAQDRVTQNLTEALKNKGKVQGDWGEQVLEQILLSSNLREGIDFEIQGSVKDDEGNNLRPDVIVHCPDGSSIIIDSKVSLTAYSDYIAATNEDERDRASKENLMSINRHVTELTNKNYNKLVQNAVPMVLMFIPNEGSYVLAFDRDPNVGLNAYKRNVVLINPTNLMLTITLVEQMWKNENRDKNVQDVMKMATDLYDKFVTFAETFDKVGQQLGTAQTTYAKAKGQLMEGRGNIVRRLDELKSKGIATAKQIPESLKE
ncbi:MAG: DNA recombination protein RmuC [Prevotellaceae bacterium]|nr:DNA recombination protein RmuC [Prevotellaceae bacterium]